MVLKMNHLGHLELGKCAEKGATERAIFSLLLYWHLLLWKSRDCYEGNAKAESWHEVSRGKRPQALGLRERCGQYTVCLSYAGLIYPSILLHGILKLEIILQMLLKQALGCLEPAIKFASFTGHSLRPRPAVVLLRYLYLIHSPDCIIQSYLYIWEERALSVKHATSDW